jgi:chemotaxis protein histidine kinase CheA
VAPIEVALVQKKEAVMFDSPEFREEFIDVGIERLAAVRIGLAALERDPIQPELVAVVLREVHTLKGEARMLGLLGIGTLSQANEDLLLWCRRQGFGVLPEVRSSVLAGVEGIAASLENDYLVHFGADARAASEQLLARLELLGDGPRPKELSAGLAQERLRETAELLTAYAESVALLTQSAAK